MGFLDRPKVRAQLAPETRWVRLRSGIRGSPWLAIALLMHVLLVAVLSIVYMASERAAPAVEPIAVSLARAPLDLAPPLAEPAPIIDRDAVPRLLDAKPGPVNPDPIYQPEADAGRPGEVTSALDPDAEPGILNPDLEAPPDLPSGATGGTPIGLGRIGHPGSKTSPFSSRELGGGGPGKDGVGQRGLGGPGGPTEQTEEAVLDALVWLKNHQSPEGLWDADGFASMCKLNVCDGPGNAMNDAGLTGLALLCFLGAGYTHDGGPFRDTVKEGLRYLIDVQDEQGCFGPQVGQHFVYNHACAALAMVEAYGMTQAKALREPAQRGIDFVLAAQNDYGAWRYSVPPDGDNDTSVTGWMIMVLKSGAMAGLKIDTAALQNALSFIEQVTDPVTGRTGYTDVGQSPSRMQSVADRFPAGRSESLTAVGLVARIFAGRTLEGDPLIAKGADLLVNQLPAWDPGAGTIDFYYWYYATLALFQVGGARWEKWNQALKTALLDRQRLDRGEDEYGSWDPLDPWALEGGRIYSTALNCLSMEVYYRYPRVFGAKAVKEGKK